MSTLTRADHIGRTVFFFIPVSSFRVKSRNLSCTLAFLPDGSTGLPVFHAISHSPFSLLPWRSLGFARDDTVGRALSIIHGSQPPALRASPPSKGRGDDSHPPSSGRRCPEGRKLASRMFNYPYPRIVISSEVEKSFLHVGVFAGWLYWFASFPCDLTLTFFPSAIKIPRLRSG